MQHPGLLLLLSATFIRAGYANGRAPIHLLRRGTSYSNSSTPAETTTTGTDNQVPSTAPYDNATHPIIAQPSITQTASGLTSPTSIYSAPTEAPVCEGSVTYTGSVPPTIYLTITEGFDVTVTASNVSTYVPETLITPPPPCHQTIMPSPLIGSMTPAESAPQRSDNLVPPSSALGKPGKPPPSPQFETEAPLAQGETTVTSAPMSAIYSSVPYTSTVIVTKKTPITVVVPPSANPSVNFQVTQSQPQTNNPGNDSPPNDSGDVQTLVRSSSPLPPISGNPTGTRTGSLVVPPSTQTTTNLGNIIASVINSPPISAAPTARAGATPITTTVNNVPITILPSSVVFGSSTVAIPSVTPTTVDVNGALFTVRPSEIVAPGGTITINQQQAVSTGGFIPSTTIAVNEQLTITLGETVVVISSTTFRIGAGAPATTITVDGIGISVGPSGVGLPQTTVAPGPFLPFAVYTVDGITYSVGSTDVVVSGTTYQIGNNAPQTTTVIGGETVSLGPGGVGLKSTTLVPSSTSSGSSPSRSTSSSSAASATESASIGGGVISTLRIPFSEVLGWCLITAVGSYVLV